MASSGTEVHWMRLGLGKGSRRRHWAWAEEAADGSPPGWGTERPFPNPASPAPLEDFHLARPPLEWGPALQESGGSSGEETEAEDVDSPEGSMLPLPWLPRQDQPLDQTEEEPDEAHGSSEVEAAGESSPMLGCEPALLSEGKGDTSPMALGRGQARDWVASSQQAEGKKLSEHPEVHPTVELSSARSWGSETVSLGHPSDSLDSTWEGETEVPQPTAEPLLHPDDRTGGPVAQATPTGFQDSSAPPTWGPQCPAGTWGRETVSLSSSQCEDRAWKQTKTSPKPLPSRFTGSISPLCPQPKLSRKDRSQTRQGATLAGHSSSDGPKYGRGRLNYPLPDFSKVGPRVRFPKDESYRPPKARGHSRQPQGPTGPLIFKSPAEIVQEVLLSSGEASLAKDPPPSHPITRVPQEFQTPEQATELVHQLQEDYHKLLTKYAEAENTIDQLRLGAKVNLYSDPPQPRHGVHMGMVPQGTKVLSFTIPQPRTAEWSGPAQDPQASEATGWPSVQGDLSPSLHPSKPTPGWPPESKGIAAEQPSAEWTQALASRASHLLARVQSFEGRMQAGCLAPQNQLKGTRRLRVAHAALQEEYRQARRKQPPALQHAGSKRTPGDFDPCRELETELDHLGVRLDELEDHMAQTQHEPERSRPDLALDSAPTTPFPACMPAPPGQGSSPASLTTQPEPAAPATVGPSPGSSEVASSARTLAAPPWGQELQGESGFHGLLERYLSVKSPPEALRAEKQEELEEDREQEEEEEDGGALEVDVAALAQGKAEATRVPRGRHLVQAERSHRAPPQETVEPVVSLKPPGFQTPRARDGYMLGQGQGQAEAAPPGPGGHPDPRGTQSTASHQSSMTSLEESGTSERLPRKSTRRASGPHAEEPWMASPETDSGFVGSETSRASPLTQTPEHRFSHTSTRGTSAPRFTASVPHDGASHPKARGPVVPRRAAEPSMPRTLAQRHLPSPSSPLPQRTPSSRVEQALAAEMAVPSAEFEGRKRKSEQLLRSKMISPAATPGPTTVPSPHGPAESTPNLLLTRTGRDQAIRELQAEVSRLRLRLEDSLHRPPQGSLMYPESTFEHPTQSRDQPANSSATWDAHCGSKSTERLSGEPEGAEQAGPVGRRRARSSSVPREVLSLSSESEPPSPLPSSEKIRATKDCLRPAQEGARRAGGTRRPDRVSFRGQYTGQEYHILSPKAVPRDSSTASCPHCQPVRTQNAEDAATRNPLGPSATDALRCPLCGRTGSPAEGDGSGSAPSGTEKSTVRRRTPSASSPKQKTQRAASLPRPPPGLWYLAAAPPSPALPAFAYISSVPIMPYPPANVYYVPPAPTSAPAGSQKPARGHRHSIQLDPEALEELHAALGQAVQAAEHVRATTHQMRRALSADLCQAQGLRGSCLF